MIVSLCGCVCGVSAAVLALKVITRTIFGGFGIVFDDFGIVFGDFCLFFGFPGGGIFRGDCSGRPGMIV